MFYAMSEPIAGCAPREHHPTPNGISCSTAAEAQANRVVRDLVSLCRCFTDCIGQIAGSVVRGALNSSAILTPTMIPVRAGVALLCVNPQLTLRQNEGRQLGAAGHGVCN